MEATIFDSLGYFEKLKAAGVPEEQAKVQANAFRDFTSLQEEKARKELATRMDVLQCKMELAEKMEAGKNEILKWLIGLLLAQSAMLASVMALTG